MTTVMVVMMISIRIIMLTTLKLISVKQNYNSIASEI